MFTHDPYAFVDIHLHADGSLSMEQVRRLAEVGEHDDVLSASEEELRGRLTVQEHCRDLVEYLEKFDFPLSLLQKREQIELHFEMLSAELAELGMAYAELRFAPQYHTLEGLSQREVVEAAIAGISKGGPVEGLILCCMRGEDNTAENMETTELACEYHGKGVLALDLAGAEALFPARDYAEFFRIAADAGLPYTIHAGEAAGPESIREALALGTKRIGHGVRAVEDPELMEQLARENICCELCPTSNLNTGVFAEYTDYPLRAFLDAGIPATVNADNMAVSGTHAGLELRALEEALGLSEDDILTLRRNAIEHSFASEATKRRLLASIRSL